MLRLLLAWLAAAPLCAWAQDAVQLSWTPPTERIDGSPLTDLAGFKVYWGTGSRDYTESDTVGPSITAYVVEDLAPSTEYFFAVTAFDSRGLESAYSNEATKTTANARPAPPTNLTATGDLTAYTLVLSRDRVALVAVGEVLPSTACDPEQAIMGMYVVPRERVVFAGNVAPQVVVASCG